MLKCKPGDEKNKERLGAARCRSMSLSLAAASRGQMSMTRCCFTARVRCAAPPVSFPRLPSTRPCTDCQFCQFSRQRQGRTSEQREHCHSLSPIVDALKHDNSKTNNNSLQSFNINKTTIPRHKRQRIACSTTWPTQPPQTANLQP